MLVKKSMLIIEIRGFVFLKANLVCENLSKVFEMKICVQFKTLIKFIHFLFPLRGLEGL
jgi:hypothetical protein